MNDEDDALNELLNDLLAIVLEAEIVKADKWSKRMDGMSLSQLRALTIQALALGDREGFADELETMYTIALERTE